MNKGFGNVIESFSFSWVQTGRPDGAENVNKFALPCINGIK